MVGAPRVLLLITQPVRQHTRRRRLPQLPWPNVWPTDLKGTGVRVNSVLPSIIDTDANRRAMPAADYTKWPKPAEITEGILFPV